MSTLEFESYNITIPLQNTPGMKDMVAIIVTQASQAIKLNDYFGVIGSGHYFSLQADGGKVYIAAAAHAATGINEQTQGNSAHVCWPIADGQTLQARLVGGPEKATGYATLMSVATGVILHAKLALSGVATGFLRIQRSSVGPGQGVEQFPPGGF